LGEQLEDVVSQLMKGGLKKSKAGGTMDLGVGTLPPLPKDATDRNRTSPFAFTGNRFEFRAAGSSQPVYMANTILNTAVAEALDDLATRLEKIKGNFNSGLTKILGEDLKAHKAVIFNGDNYSEAWHNEAAKRGLPNLKTTPDALKAMDNKAYKDLFKKYKVLSNREFGSRHEVFWERYNKALNIEALATMDIAKNLIYPAVLRYQGEVAQVVAATRQVLDQNQDGMESVLGMLAGGSQKLFEAIKALGEAHHAVERISSPEKRAFAYKDTVVSAMLAVRAVADELEGIVADDLWPLPKYREMLFQY
jgi:glutamine synthetase